MTTSNPLVVRFGAMGDMVIALALIRFLHRRFGLPVDVVSSGGWTRPLLESQPGVGRLYLIRSRKMPYPFSPAQWGLVKALRARGATPTWICEADEKCRWLIDRVGIADSYILHMRSYPHMPGEHAIDHSLRFARATPRILNGSSPQRVPDDDALRVPPLLVAPSWRMDLDEWLCTHGLAGRHLILIQAGNRSTTKWGRPRRRVTNTKYWPETHWARVIDAIAERESDAAILLMGVAAEARLNDKILSYTKTRSARNVAADLPLQRLLALQERAVGMVSVDTGPAHSGAALGCPLVVLFGDEDPAYYLPRSAGAEVRCVRGIDNARASMLGISVEAVVSAWYGLTLRNQRPCVAQESPRNLPSEIFS